MRNVHDGLTLRRYGPLTRILGQDPGTADERTRVAEQLGDPTRVMEEVLLTREPIEGDMYA